MAGAHPLALYLRRTLQVLSERASSAIRMQGLDTPSRALLPLYSMHSANVLQYFVTGSDKDMGGASSASLDVDQDGRGVFKGSLRATRMTADNVLGGYAAFRTRNRPTFFGTIFSDVTWHDFLGIRCRAAGSRQTRDSYFVNLQVDEANESREIWQHRLVFPKGDGSWEDIYIPFEKFVCTNAGFIVKPDLSKSDRVHMELQRDKLRTVGVSLLGGSENDGEFELGVENIWAVNKEDIPLSESELKAMIDVPALPSSTPVLGEASDNVT